MPLPHDVLCELIGNFTLKGSEEQQVQIAEQLASTTYEDLNSAIDAIEEFCPRLKFKYQKDRVCKSPFFNKYLKPLQI